MEVQKLRHIFQLATTSEDKDHFELCTTLQAAVKVCMNTGNALMYEI